MLTAPRLRRLAQALLVVAVTAGIATTAAAIPPPPPPAGPPFDDIAGHRYNLDIAALANTRFVRGLACSDTGPSFCPDDPAPRQIAARWLHDTLTAGDRIIVTDDRVPVFADPSPDRHLWEPHAAVLYERGVTYGCSSDPLLFCPDRILTRGQLAALVARAYRWPLPAVQGAGLFTAELAAADTAGLPAGCPTLEVSCSQQPVTRGELAAALMTALRLDDLAATGSVCAVPGVNHPRPRQITTSGMVLPETALDSVGTLRAVAVFAAWDTAPAGYDTLTELAATSSLPWPYDSARDAPDQLALAAEYLHHSSGGRFSLDIDVFHGWVPLPGEAPDPAAWPRSLSAAMTDAAAAAAAAVHGIDYDDYDLVLVILPSSRFAGGAAYINPDRLAETPVPVVVINHSAIDESPRHTWWFTASHETLHVLGVKDLYPIRGRPTPSSDNGHWHQIVVGPMGLQGIWREPATGDHDGPRLQEQMLPVFYWAREMLAWTRWQLGWLDDSQVACVTAGNDATAVLGHATDPDTETAMLVVTDDRRNLAHVVEFRRRVGYDTPTNQQATLPSEGLLVYTVNANTGYGIRPTHLATDRYGYGVLSRSPILTAGESVTTGTDTIGIYRKTRISFVSADNGTATVAVTPYTPARPPDRPPAAPSAQ